MDILILYFKKLSFNKTIRLIWFQILVLLCIIPSVFAILHAPVDPDSAYYLSIIERMNDGLFPYVDFNFSYAPFVFYLMLFLKKVFSIGINYEFYLTIHFIFQFFCGYFIYKISYLMIKRKDYAFYSSILFIITSHWYEGNVFLLETPSLFFGLTSIYLSLKYPNKIFVFLGIGLLVSISFLSKQYGLGFLGLIIFIITYNLKKWKQIGFLLIGFLLPIVVCFILWGNKFSNIFFGDYGIQSTLIEGCFAIFNRLCYFFYRIFPVLLIGIFYLSFILKNSTKTDSRNITFLILGILGFMLQFFFAPFNHYFLYIIPFASILSFLILSHITKRKWLYSVFLIFTVILSIYSTYYNRVYKIYFKHQELKEGQYILAQEILKKVDKSKTLYIIDIMLIPQYYLTNMIPPNIKTIGYSFGKALNQQTHLKQITTANYILKYKLNYNEFNLNTLDVSRALQSKKKYYLDSQVNLYK